MEAYPVRGLLPLERTSNKRSFRDRRDNKIRLYQPEREEEDDVKGVPRIIMDLVVGDQSEDADIAKDMANKLYEEKEELICKDLKLRPMFLLLNFLVVTVTILRVVGKEKAFGYFKEVKRIEEAGGMPIMVCVVSERSKLYHNKIPFCRTKQGDELPVASSFFL